MTSLRLLPFVLLLVAASCGAPDSDEQMQVVLPQLDWRVQPESPRAWTTLVLHHSATAAGNAGQFHRSHLDRGWDGLGYHFVIANGRGGPDGRIEVGWRWIAQREGAHAGDTEHNEHGIGICLVGDFERDAPTAAQLASLSELCRWLMARYDIGPDAVKLHREVRSRGPTACPGRNFPVERVLQALQD